MTPTTRFAPQHTGDVVSGHVVEVSSTTSEYTSDLIPVVTLDTDSGPVTVEGFHISLRSELQRVSVGQHAAVTYTGRRHATGRVRHSYRVTTV